MSVIGDLDDFQRHVLRFVTEESRRLGGKPVATLHIVQSLRENKKKVNAALYKLQNVHIIEKVNEIPPKWLSADKSSIQYSNQPNAPSQIQNMERKCMQLTLENALDCSNSMETHLDTQFTRELKPISINVPAKQLPMRHSQIHKRILTHLENEPKPIQTIKLALALGYTRKREINPFLYELQRQGLLRRSSENPPMWVLNKETRDTMVAKNFQVSNNIPTVNNNGKISSMSIAMQELQLHGLSKEHELPAISTQDFTYLTRNPVSAFLEHAQANHVNGEIQITSTTGPPHDPNFEAVAILGSQSFPSATGKSKKQAKLLAAECALKTLAANGFLNKSSTDLSAMKLIGSGRTGTIFDEITTLSHRQYYNLTLNLPEVYTAGRKIIAAIVMKEGNSAGVVVSLGTGNRVIPGGKLSQVGDVLNDCHAEIIARRAFRVYLFQQLISCLTNKGSSQSIFQISQENQFQIRQDVTFHLYISTAPCGDGAIFSQNDLIDAVPSDHVSEHTPSYSSDTHGQLRTKIENGEGSVLIDKDIGELTWDGMSRGEQRLRTMSCSDKIAKWNVLGLQGALLSNFIKPIYLNSVTIGYLFCKNHLARALCCRLAKEDNVDKHLPTNFLLNHPMLGSVTASDPLREAQKTKPYSLNWTFGDEKIELVDSSSGQCINNETKISRLCKYMMFKKFKEMCIIMKIDRLLRLKSYAMAKDAAVDYCKAKRVMEKQFQTQNMGLWLHKPIEEKSFSILE